MLLMRGIRIVTVYKILGENDGSSYNQVVDPMTNKILSCMVDLTMFWHRRLGHIGEK